MFIKSSYEFSKAYQKVVLHVPYIESYVMESKQNGRLKITKNNIFFSSKLIKKCKSKIQSIDSIEDVSDAAIA
jgi:hypothetical protein